LISAVTMMMAQPQSATDREIGDAVLRLQLGGERRDLLDRLDNGATDVSCEPMCIWSPLIARFGYLAAARIGGGGVL